MLNACVVGQPSGYVDVSVASGNYAADSIYDFRIHTDSGKGAGASGGQVLEFPRGRTSGRECCPLMPGVGQTVDVAWRVGG
jgi:hypothetical protein